MAMKDMQKMKEFLAEKKQKELIKQHERKVGNGRVEKGNRMLGLDSERTNPIN